MEILPDTTTAGPVAMLMVHDSAQALTSEGLQLFSEAHHITPAERRVVELLLHDRAPKQIADNLGVAIRTVRTQLSSVFTKTGTRNQRELVKAVLAQFH